MEEPNCAGSGQGVLVLHSVPSHAHTTLIHALDHSPDLQIEINQYDDGTTRSVARRGMRLIKIPSPVLFCFECPR